MTQPSPSGPHELARHFDAAAASYDRAFEDPGPEGHALRSRQVAVLQLAGSGPGEALDAGMGPGRLAAALRDRGWAVSGVDVSPAMVAAARARLPEAAGRLVEGSIEALPFAEGAFDLAVATGVVEYVEETVALGELARVLRSGGRLVVSMPNPRAPYGVWRRRLVYPASRAARRFRRRARPPRLKHRPLVAPAAFVALLRASGFEPEILVPVNAQLALTPLDELAPKAAAELADRLERRGGRLSRIISTQLVFSARRRG